MRPEEIDWVHSEGVYEIVPMQECRDAGKQRLDLIRGHARKFDRGCVQESTKRKRKLRFNELHQLLNCSLQCHLSKQKDACLNHDVGEFVEQRETIEVETLRHQQSTCQKYGEVKVDRLVKSMYGTQDASHIWQLDFVNLICGELGGFRRGNTVQHCFPIGIKM